MNRSSRPPIVDPVATRPLRTSLAAAALWLACAPLSTATAATVSGERLKWHPITVDFRGPSANERDDAPNPFLDYRLEVEFIAPSGRRTRVPGFFAGDGRGGDGGDVWRARFSADEVGEWRYAASLRRGEDVAISLESEAGEAIALAAASGGFRVDPQPSDAPGFLRFGRLEYVGGHYLKFRDGPYWIKGGTDSPENMLGYVGFDSTADQGGPDGGGFLHDFAAHRRDFRPGDPEFASRDTGADGRGLVGALNYLGDEGVNSIYFLPMNLGGDAQDTYPFVGATRDAYTKTHYDLGKLHQWNTVLEHAQRRGVALQIVLSETEPDNERWLDDGALGVERKLFFRELVARFGHLLALKWNLGEENDFPPEELRRHADYLDALDWSDKPIAVHTRINDFRDYEAIVGDPRFDATSIQYDAPFAGEFVELWRRRSREAGRPWIVDMDENTDGVNAAAADQRRRQILYDVYFSGGHIEWFFGSAPLPEGGDQNAGDFRVREVIWRQTRHARRFMEQELPFWRMRPADELVDGESDPYGGAEVLALDGEVYALYLPATNGGERLDLRGATGAFTQRWFDPTVGRFVGDARRLDGGTTVGLGSPPARAGADWVVLLRRDGVPGGDPADGPSTASSEGDAAPRDGVGARPPTVNAPPRFDSPDRVRATSGERFVLDVRASDPDGTPPSIGVDALPRGMRVEPVSGGALTLVWDVPEGAGGEATIELSAYDARDPALAVTQRVRVSVGGSAADAGGNAPPRFDSPATVAATRGVRLTLTVTASDPDGHAPAMGVSALPAGMQVDDAVGGALTFVWDVPRDAGNEAAIELFAIDTRDERLRVEGRVRILMGD